MAAQEPEDVGRKGGAAGYAAVHPYYEPTVTAVTDIVVPATRIQWGPVFAGLLISLAVALLWTSLGVAIGIGPVGMAYWTIGFAALGLFLGSMFAARTAKASLWPAIMHAVIIWAIVLVLSTFSASSIGAALAGRLLVPSAAGAGPAVGAPSTAAVSGVGWAYFGGFLVLLAASILGGIAGMNPPERQAEGPHAQADERQVNP